MKVSKIDLKSQNASEELYNSLCNTGFAIVTNHGINEDLIYDVYTQWEIFFSSKDKLNYKAKDGGSAGFFPMKSENAKGYSVKDLKEFYHIFGPFNKNIPLEMNQNVPYLASELELLGIFLLSQINYEHHKKEGIDLNLADMARNSHNTLFRILHYPPLPEDAEEGAVRAAPHEDINLITLLPSATFPGLSVKDNDGNWHLIDSNEGEIVINVGDMLKEATNGKFKSTTHRVCNPAGLGAKHSRYSMPLFIHPRPEVRLSEKYTAGEYLEERLKEIGLKK